MFLEDHFWKLALHVAYFQQICSDYAVDFWKKEILCAKNWQSSCLNIAQYSIWLQTIIKLGKLQIWLASSQVSCYSILFYSLMVTYGMIDGGCVVICTGMTVCWYYVLNTTTVWLQVIDSALTVHNVDL